MTSLTERAEILDRFQRSGQTRKAFSEAEGVGFSTLRYWLAGERRKAQDRVAAAPMVFREFRLAGPGPEREGAWAMEVVSPGGLTIRSREPLPSGLVVRLLTGGKC